MSEDELVFASEEEAIQHLSNITGDEIKIAKHESKHGPHEFEGVVYLNSPDGEEADEVAVNVEFDFSEEEAETNSPKDYDITSVKRKDDKQQIIDTLSEDQIKDLKDGAAEEIERQHSEDAATLEDHYDAKRQDRDA